MKNTEIRLFLIFGTWRKLFIVSFSRWKKKVNSPNTDNFSSSWTSYKSMFIIFSGWYNLSALLCWVTWQVIDPPTIFYINHEDPRNHCYKLTFFNMVGLMWLEEGFFFVLERKIVLELSTLLFRILEQTTVDLSYRKVHSSLYDFVFQVIEFSFPREWF